MSTLLIKGGRIIDPARNVDAVGDLWLVDGKISDRPRGSVAETIDAAGLIVCPGLIDVENVKPEQSPRAGFIHVSNMARVLMFALSLDRNVVLEDINLYAR